ncbi:methyl-accepting chemotaxis (MCP) signaling domain protein [Lyngbya aestuarii BL J]|uniref:Methyl-accepting chemotaxis (MCP) signaling domain protein n=1 Tax=Lyngbya aestuarii BL J TaxID=1348334 RepID=U7QCG2_9CYAN|nr:methyl-accepting chemotaxis protein [Lyngbya aestuarii]ERT04396.1 methyl-accepting chemotaxis (MCP) signaling domain protein [Lyngbya aestuarii BL J]
MQASTDFLQEYQQTEAAYNQGNYEEAAALVYQLVENYPEDPSARLLCGYIYGYGLQQFEVAREQYFAVLELTDDPELIDQAHEAMTQADQYIADSAAYAVSGDLGSGVALDDPDDLGTADTQLEDSELMAETAISHADKDQFANHSETQLDSELNLDELEELSVSDLDSSPLNAEIDIDLSKSPLEALGMEAEADLDEISIDLCDDDLGLEDLSGDLQFEDLMNSGNLDSESPENPFAQGDPGASDPIDENDAIATQLESDPFELDDEQLSDSGEPDILQPDEDWSGNFLAEEPPENYDTHPQSDTPETDSEEAFEIDDIMELGDFEDDEPAATAPEQNGRSQTPPTVTDSTASSDVSENAEGIDLDEFNSDLDDIFQSLQFSELGENEDISEDLHFSSSDQPATTAATLTEEANGKSYIPPTEEIEEFDEEFDEELHGGDAEAETLLMEPSGSTEDDFQLDAQSGFTLDDFTADPDPESDDDDEQTPSFLNQSSWSNGSSVNNGNSDHEEMFDASEIPDSFGLDAFDDETFAEESDFSHANGTGHTPDDEFSDEFTESEDFNEDLNTTSSNLDEDDFLDNFDEFDDLGNLPDFEASREEEAAFISDSSGFNEEVDSDFTVTASSALDRDNSAISNDELFNVPLDQEVVTTFTSQIDEPAETTVTVEQGAFAFLENKTFKVKFFYTALGTGVATLILVATATNIITQTAALNQKREVVNSLRTSGWIVTMVAGVTSFLSAWGLGNIASRQMSKASQDLQHQFDSISRNNLKARATVYAIDELGQMSAKFNHMAQFIETTTVEAQRKAEEQEEAKENLQRQVIRLLDDVEGAARGDLTVTAEVTADVLGAVADSFNLTIQNLREIVVQVKQAARQVSKGATDSATFAKDVAGDALRQAEELAATLNSVQVLTDAIQRVADSAREAEEVARTAADVATRGGEAVQMTVAGILKIRETVAETTREVKRLAESSQEISKIVAIISTIASRTNLLALNASIEAARAGEAGRGFAIVADEVRQLADRSAKSLKDIEQIVMQIQSQTNSVMMAMEEGNQQVIDGTRLAEKAKQSLDDIIQVTNRIDVLVRSITADTVEQNETARAVAQVMQAVEHSAQETSQEAHRVSNALSNLVGVARDLLTSVERFRVDPSERK